MGNHLYGIYGKGSVDGEHAVQHFQGAGVAQIIRAEILLVDGEENLEVVCVRSVRED